LKPLTYRVFAANPNGGKLVAVYLDQTGLNESEMLQFAQKAPLTVFVGPSERAAAKLLCFSPKGKKAESDSAAVAVLSALESQEAGLLEWADGSTVAWQASKVGGQYLLLQGDPVVAPVELERAAVATALGLDEGDLHEDLPLLTSSLGRPNLIVPLNGTIQLDAIEAEAEKLMQLNHTSHSTGVVAFSFPGRAKAFIDARCFGPLRGFLEDVASSNMLACLAGYLAQARFFDDGPREFLATQGHALGQASRLALKCTIEHDVASQVWVGGAAKLEVS
jgi:PhzF family phenazine biosynthesis protein